MIAHSIKLWKDGHFVGIDIPLEPVNIKLKLEDETYLEIKAPNAEGYVPYPQCWH